MRAASPNYAPWANLLAGILAIMSPWVLRTASTGVAWDITITGIIIAVVSLIVMSTHGKLSTNYWPIVNIAAGIWLLISLTFIHDDLAMTWSNIVLGSMVFVGGIVSEAHEAQASRTPLEA